ncbi:MAG: amylosucrase [Hasllibacter sp.]
MKNRRPPLDDAALFALRWSRNAADALAPLARLYPRAEGLETRLRALLERHAEERPADLRRLDLARDVNPNWFLSNDMVGYVFYVDRFAGRLRDVPGRIPYLQSLGVTYAHMMPLLKPRPGDSDGGYAVMDYRATDPALGTMDDLQRTCRKLREAGISPCIDMVLNHTAKEHEWAVRAAEGDPEHRALYRVYDPADPEPDAYEETLLDIFPAQAPGNFTLYPDEGIRVWTTFNEFQWDLNWANPDVFFRILDTLLWLANRGVEVFRLDAVAFMWKRLGTQCQNLPEVHDILQAICQATRIAAPAVIYKAEAIVGPTDLVTYLGLGRYQGRESNLAYHNNLMVQFWSSLASGETGLMEHVLATHFPVQFRRATWATYVRCHDDIGWAITEEDAAAMPHMDGPGHRRFLADFYAGRFETSFARGADFQVNEETGDRRTNGSFASLAGLEAALEAGDPAAVDMACRRIRLGHALIAAHGGVPLIYMGDEVGLTNAEDWRDDPVKAGDGRWMQRPAMDWDLARGEGPAADAARRILAETRAIMARRKATPALSGLSPTRILRTPDPAILAISREADDGMLTAVFSFSPQDREVLLGDLGLDPGAPWLCALEDRPAAIRDGRLRLPPHGVAWLTAG